MIEVPTFVLAGVGIALCLVVGALAIVVARLEERVARLEREGMELRRAVGTPMGQIVPTGSLETTDGPPRPASLSLEAAEAGVSGEGRPEPPVAVRIISPERAKRSLEAKYAMRARVLREAGGGSAS